MKFVTILFFVIVCCTIALINLKPETENPMGDSHASIVNANPMKANTEQYKRIQPNFYVQGNQ